MWSLVLRIGAHPGAKAPLVVYAYPSSSLHLLSFTSYNRASTYVFVYDQCCSHTTAARGLTRVQRGPEHITYRKVYREINGQKRENV